MRMVMLFSLHQTRLEDNERDTGQQQMYVRCATPYE